VLRQASETGQLFGSVSVRDIIASFEPTSSPSTAARSMLDAPIKTIGKHNLAIAVHHEVEVQRQRHGARSAEKPNAYNRGEDISTRQEDQDCGCAKRSPPPASSSIRKPSTTTSQRRRPKRRNKFSIVQEPGSDWSEPGSIFVFDGFSSCEPSGTNG